jgi:3-deoxy-manno-octulosonate cytidylyltransferase (CMP-KDO synthetase)
VPDHGQALCVIPARYASTRFPGKPLASIAGKPMIQRVWEMASRARLVGRVVVATDDRRIVEAVEGFGGEAVLTSSEHRSGTDRVAEVARRIQAPFYINVQGDEPLIEPGVVDAVARMLAAGSPMSTLAGRITTRGDLFDPNVVKVIVDRLGHALYFSRYAVPFPRLYLDRGGDVDLGTSTYLRHIGTYGYSASALGEVAGAPRCQIEELESLEQLRALYLGIKIRVEVVRASSPCVDVPGDIAKVEKILAARGAD